MHMPSSPAADGVPINTVKAIPSAGCGRVGQASIASEMQGLKAGELTDGISLNKAPLPPGS